MNKGGAMKKILVLCGGISNEREVSLVSGEAVRQALVRKGFAVEKHDFDGDAEALIHAARGFAPDAVFNILHGEYGEDGRVQALLDMIGIPYTHSGFSASALCMDKFAANSVLRANGVPVPKSKIAGEGDFHMPLPFVLKPVRGGSSIGVHIVRSDGFAWPYRPGETIMAEEYIPGREITISILSGRALGITEIAFDGGFYDYERKYKPGAARHICPADLDKTEADRALATAEDAYRILGCSGLARADFRYDGRDFYFLEMNTQPGMTPTSLSPEHAALHGITFDDLCAAIVEAAL
ncbi:MAG: D-alanine--D-alanine ligase [Rickettsiales bacterium]|jgi:D-alanine-D-alanine ligase|nr:D-alanine--D-alanine ligase [Rickettsiales bacterium]